MSLFIALLRGVNVGGARQVPMAVLRSTLTDMGLVDVRTYLQSGNIVFCGESGRAAAYARAIRSRIDESLGVEADTLVLPCAAFARIAAENPFLAREPDLDPRWLHVAFPFEPVTAEAVEASIGLAADGERAVLGNGVVYLVLPHGVGRSKLGAGLGRALKTSLTARNWRTVLALVEMCGDGRG